MELTYINTEIAYGGGGGSNYYPTGAYDLPAGGSGGGGSGGSPLYPHVFGLGLGGAGTYLKYYGTNGGQYSLNDASGGAGGGGALTPGDETGNGGTGE